MRNAQSQRIQHEKRYYRKKNVMEEAIWYYYNVIYQAAVVRGEGREIDIQVMEEHAYNT